MNRKIKGNQVSASEQNRNKKSREETKEETHNFHKSANTNVKKFIKATKFRSLEQIKSYGKCIGGTVLIFIKVCDKFNVYHTGKNLDKTSSKGKSFDDGFANSS